MVTAYVFMNCNSGAEQIIIQELDDLPEVKEVRGIYGIYDIFVWWCGHMNEYKINTNFGILCLIQALFILEPICWVL